MHDEMLERRLHDALRAEGDALGLTITSAELERRLAARRRGRTTRGFGLLLAAALSVGAVGATAIGGGWFNRATGPLPSQQARVSQPTPSAAPVATEAIAPGQEPTLPTLDELMQRDGTAGLVVAQGHGPEVAGMIDTAGAIESLLDLGPIDGHGTYRVDFGCVASGGTSELAGIATVLAGSAVGRPVGTIPCDGTVATRSLDRVTGSFFVRVATPPQSSWRILVRLADGPDLPPLAGLSEPVAAPGQTAVVDASGDHRRPSPTTAPDTSAELGTLPFRPIYHVGASCLGSQSMEWLVGVRDSSKSVVADTTTVVPCDGRVHAADLHLGELNWHDVFVRAGARTDWHLLVTVQPPPISTAPDVPGWRLSTNAGPIYTFSDIGWDLVGAARPGPREVRIVVTCLGGTEVGVEVMSGSSDVNPPIDTFTAPCAADTVKTVTETVTVPEGQYLVATHPHGRMWFSATVQEQTRVIR
jgi:hypothetical protein